MKEQNAKNHTRISLSYHLITGTALLALLIGSFINLANSSDDNLYSASLICLSSLILLSIFLHARIFGLKAQDRAIRAEENFRYYILTGKPLSSSLSVAQVIALRFASDDEFPTLAERAAKEKLTNKEIKAAIKNWRADHHRV
ncbi:MAG: hypothetical protein JWQ96_2713 [Segetibacter sp.]|nr:hypothetical protein [Segetibacter sp.]